MSNQLQNVNLPTDAFNICDIHYPFLLEDLDCDRLATKLVCAKLNLPKGPGADGTPKPVATDAAAGLRAQIGAACSSRVFIRCYSTLQQYQYIIDSSITIRCEFEVFLWPRQTP